MPKRVEYKTQTDFTGGLNLSRARVQLEDDETPDCLNVDVDPRGGFGMRKGYEGYLGTVVALPGVAHSLLAYGTTGASATVLAGNGTVLYRNVAGTWTSTVTGLPTGGPWRGVTFKDRLYIFTGNAVVKRWDGSAVVTTTDPAVAGWNDNIAAPTAFAATGDVPKAKVGATFMGSMFCANITENTTAYPCRVRWSHPMYPEDWFSTHYIDIVPEDGDEITALVPLGDRLLVFKHNSIYAIYGAPPESLSVTQVSRELGAPTQECVTTTDLGVMFWHEGSGAHLLSSSILEGTKRSWIGERIWPAIEDGRITSGRMDEVKIGWLNRRLWVAVPYEGSTTRNRVFVYDPFCGKDGAWTFYDVPCGPFVSLPQSGDTALPIAAHSTSATLLKLEVFDKTFDMTATHITSYYTTRWWDDNSPLVKKRWKRPEAVLLSGQTAVIPVAVYRDFDPSEGVKSFNLTTTADSTEAVWDTAVWDSAVWGREDGERNQVERGSPLGNARAVALKFMGPATNVNWRVDALTLKWISKRVRN